MNKNIVPHKHQVSKEDRRQQRDHRSLVIWFTGLSGSGKSTLANLLEQCLFDMGYHTYILDGDNVRTGLNKDLGFAAADRKENIRRIGEVCKLMVDAGIIVLAAFISPFRQDRQKLKNLFEESEFIEVFVDCPVEVCEQRDMKGLYAKARKGEIKNFTGIDSPFEVPESPDTTIHTDKQDLDSSIANLLKVILPKLKAEKIHA